MRIVTNCLICAIEIFLSRLVRFNAYTVVQAVVKVMGKGKFRPSFGSKTPERISMKLRIYNYVTRAWPHMQIRVGPRPRGRFRRTHDMSNVLVSYATFLFVGSRPGQATDCYKCGSWLL